ncbi:MAG: efflux RND transporter periplasmic adaptor subunit [Spirochaetales bacterium]|nr:efflux RND transporter periplasmic adaptor subunit [Spirochaetales bacterium]
MMKNFFPLSLFIMLIFYHACSGEDSDGGTYATYSAPDDVPALSVDVLEVSKGALIEEIRVSGIIEGNNEVDVVSETSGIIVSIGFEAGDTVAKGEALVKVDDSIALYTRNQAALDLETARLDLEAKEKFYKSGNTSLLELTRAKSVFNGQKARYESALKAYEDTTIRTPIAGTVARREQGISAGNYLNRGQRIARIIDDSAFILRASVGERQVVLLEIGSEAVVDVPAAGENRISATVTAVAGGSDRETGSFPVLISWKNSKAGDVKSGMSAVADIKTKSGDTAVIIPLSSIVNREGGTYVFVAKDGKAEAALIRPGERFGERIVVEAGLEPGDLLVISRISSLKPGYPVRASVVGKSGGYR